MYNDPNRPNQSEYDPQQQPYTPYPPQPQYQQYPPDQGYQPDMRHLQTAPPLPPKKGLPKWALFGCGGLLLLSLFVCVVAATTHGSTNTDATTYQQTAVGNTPPVATDTSDTSSNSSSVNFKVGQTASTPGGYGVTVLKVYDSHGDEFSKPDSGTQFLIVDLSVKNNTGQAQSLSSLVQFTLTDSTGQKIDSVIDTENGVHQVDGTIQNGATARGQIVYQVPTGKHPYQFAFSDDAFSTNQSIWSIHS